MTGYRPGTLTCMNHTKAGQPGPIKRAVIYTRVSADTAAGRSVTEQEHECRQECQRRGWPVAEVLTDNDRSASRYATKQRTAYQRLQQMLRPGDVLVTWEASRAQRDLARYVELRDLCAQLGVHWSYSGRLFDLNDESDRFSTGLDALMAEREAEQIRARILRGHRNRLAEGKPHGRVPYGYRIVRDPDSGKSIGREPHPQQALLVQKAARDLIAGKPLLAVTRWLAGQDTSRAWDAQTVRRLLTNPALAGYRTHHGEIARRGTWEPILTDDEFAAIASLFAARRSGPRGAPVKHLLTGIAVCSVCKGGLERSLGSVERSTGKRSLVLRCPSRPSHMARKMADVDTAVVEVVEALLSDPAAVAAFQAARCDDTEMAAAAAGLRDLEQRLEAVEEQIAQGEMPASVGARVTAKIAKQIEAAETAAAQRVPTPEVDSILTAGDPLSVWRHATVAEKRAFLKSGFAISVAPIGGGRWHDRRAGIEVGPATAG